MARLGGFWGAMLVEQGHASYGMAGNGNAEEIPINLYDFITPTTRSSPGIAEASAR
ncbi:hypothetical protein [Candidatus Nitrospira allomarina]|uniref:Uncharacterized protein n=1 Tax=Candidatus Nitrospira allomarina TaxID=3020900 RepID=A0AA96GJU0_9BACT|nr:hypothetical protein [Candidatus Nitrospira allomarina]WNM58931.1 hypothetical protein PP769_03960 [Candidatus Nitrospira allomarina]